MELLLNRRRVRGVKRYLVRWRGHTSADDESPPPVDGRRRAGRRDSDTPPLPPAVAPPPPASPPPAAPPPVVARHGPEVPKFVFMAVCFKTHGHAKSLAQFITISVGSPSTYILLKFKKLNLSPSQQDPNWARHLKMPSR